MFKIQGFGWEDDFEYCNFSIEKKSKQFKIYIWQPKTIVMTYGLNFCDVRI